MNVKSKKIGKNIYFDNFVVVKEDDNFFGVYERLSRWEKNYNKENILTSGTTLEKACKKAKLLQIGYDIARYNLVD